MDKTNAIGSAQIAAGGYVGYKGIQHGLPRALGIRIEYHTTSKANAELIKKAGNILDPSFGGKNGWAAKVKCDSYINNSKNYIHITGTHPDHLKKIPKLKYLRTIFKRAQNLMYKTVGNVKDFEKMFFTTDKKHFLKNLKEIFLLNILKNNTKRFCIPGIDSYFNSHFIPDTDDIALKTTEKLKVYNGRLSAMLAGLKKFGLKGMKENKGRVAFGLVIVAFTGYVATKLIKSGLDKFKNKQVN